VGTGFVEVEGDTVSVLTDSLEEASAIDRERAKRTLADADEKLKTLGEGDPAYGEQHRRAEPVRRRVPVPRTTSVT
jgi:F0F1-type ATP synthase epsilon subunit